MVAVGTEGRAAMFGAQDQCQRDLAQSCLGSGAGARKISTKRMARPSLTPGSMSSSRLSRRGRRGGDDGGAKTGSVGERMVPTSRAVASSSPG